jgi:4-oxalocrotonate tautomerase
MPILNVKVSTAANAEIGASINSGLSELTARILHKNPEVTALTIDFVPPEHWYVGGKTLREHDRNSFYFDIKIVDGTNTKEEKSRYIAESFAFFAGLLGNLHPESYIHVHDVRADAYGFAGQTQEYRYIKAKA